MKLNTQKYTFVTALHGNETMPTQALSSKNIPQVIGNPLAIEKNQRFIDMDLNKSFGESGNSYEEKRAKEILTQIPKDSLVVDFHTTSSTTPPFAIVVDLDLVPFAQTLGLKHIVYMKHNIKSGHALINHRNGVSIEAGTHDTKEAFDETLKTISNITKNKKNKATLYEVFDIITTPGEYQNFTLYKNDFYPVLAGEKAYDFYGLKAKKIGDLN